jgi:CdiI immunity protein
MSTVHPWHFEMNSYPQLAHLAGAYFHQDYDLDGPTAADIISDFADGEGGAARQELGAEITNILDSGMTSKQIGDLWISTLQASYEPGRDGLSYREWLARTLHILSETGAPRDADIG